MKRLGCDILLDLVDLVACGAVEVPVASAHPLDRGTDAFAELELGHKHGKARVRAPCSLPGLRSVHTQERKRRQACNGVADAEHFSPSAKPPSAPVRSPRRRRPCRRRCLRTSPVHRGVVGALLGRRGRP
ncbi:hypothetical protein [Streptomyces sp. NBC_00582]|uniref:hypothetical protein n=1 Tax=Streptomyces sp. NBC_00582 TaxID=2975783 RepID=UPI003FCD91FF